MNEQFKQDVDRGLSGTPKTLQSKYFYDSIGDDLFVQIMGLPEYYLTRAEYEIFSEQTEQLAAALGLNQNQHVELVELGAGDGTKTKKLLHFLLNEGYSISYQPVDISPFALSNLEQSLAKEMPNLEVKTRQGDYFEVLGSMRNSAAPKVVLFLGSNLGNMPDEKAGKFICTLSENLNPGDRLLLGLDLIKSPEVVIPAYNDSQGITADFNLNLLRRINRELGGNFELDNFRHRVTYTREEGIVKSFLESVCEQEVTIDAIGKTFHFEEGETIHTEISRKYNDHILNEFIEGSSFVVTDRLSDRLGRFADYVLLRE